MSLFQVRPRRQDLFQLRDCIDVLRRWPGMLRSTNFSLRLAAPQLSQTRIYNLKMPLTNIFISSTFEDLKEHRRSVWEMLRKRPDIKVHGMEEFGARAETPLETCLAEVEQADVY